MDKKLVISIAVVAILLIGVSIVQSTQKNKKDPDLLEQINNSEEGGNMNQINNVSPSPETQPKMQIDTNKTYKAIMTTTEGVITIALNMKTPITANNFVYLSQKGFYNNTIFHRAIKNFMIQGGDPKGDGTGGPGYKFDDEPFEGEYSRGTIAMANSGPNTNGSQFFIMHKDYALSKNYVIFGKVTEGVDVVDKIAEAPVEPSAMGENSKPINPVKILSIKIIEE